jgi:hypothetical protein
MTNRTIGQDARAILAAVARLPYAAVPSDRDAAGIGILHALTSTPTSPLPETRRHPHGNDRPQAIPPLGVATTYHWTAQATSRMGARYGTTTQR